jgi:uncharacterized membrane protein YdbT with pleckstrin-like domain
MEYKQTSKALVVRALTLWWWFGLILLGIPILVDLLRYARHRLIVGEKSVIVELGVLTRNSREMPFSKIQSVTVSQSLFGQMLNYGSIQIVSANEYTPIVFKYVDRPDDLKRRLQDKIPS